MLYSHTHPALEALFASLQHSVSPQGRCLFIGALQHPALQDLNVDVQQYFKPAALALAAQGHTALPEIPQDSATYDTVLILIPKNKVEAYYFVASGLNALKPGGRILCAAGNKEGGKTLKKMLQFFGLDNIAENAKNKSRCVYAVKKNIDEKALINCLTEGSIQPVLGQKYISKPGVFGWNKVDKGSQILLQHLPDALKGHGADFGCGYGFLSLALLQQNTSIETLHCIDADSRAVDLCSINCKTISTQTTCHFTWDDLTAPQEPCRNLDFIVMNPPFHVGKETNANIGKAFIDSAHAFLKKGGQLHIVANAHLPYDLLLNEKFQICEKQYEGEGFKVFAVTK